MDETEVTELCTHPAGALEPWGDPGGIRPGGLFCKVCGERDVADPVGRSVPRRPKADGVETKLPPTFVSIEVSEDAPGLPAGVYTFFSKEARLEIRRGATGLREQWIHVEAAEATSVRLRDSDREASS